MMSGQGMMGQGMMGQEETPNPNMPGHYGMMGRCPMGKTMMGGMSMGAMMGTTMVPTEDGGVVILMGNKLYKYDKALKLTKEAEVPVDYKNIKNTMMKMQDMGMGMNWGTPQQNTPAAPEGAK